jgi:hypothetical protein
LLTTAAALAVDLLRLALGHTAAAEPLRLASETLRFARTVLCVLVFWPCRPGVGDPIDTRLLGLACMLCIPADYFLILERQLKAGIGIFFVVQALLLARHLRRVAWRQLQARRHGLGAAFTLLVFGAGNAFLYPLLAPKGLAVPVLAYSALLLLACLSAFLLTGAPGAAAPNAGLMFAGMVLFVLCDITVGVGAALQPAPLADAVRAITGLFYTPCLLLLAVSAWPFTPAGGHPA